MKATMMASPDAHPQLSSLRLSLLMKYAATSRHFTVATVLNENRVSPPCSRPMFRGPWILYVAIYHIRVLRAASRRRKYVPGTSRGHVAAVVHSRCWSALLRYLILNSELDRQRRVAHPGVDALRLQLSVCQVTVNAK